MVRDKKSSEIMAEELQISVETMLYSATDAKLQDVSSKSGLDVVGKKETVNKPHKRRLKALLALKLRMTTSCCLFVKIWLLL